MGMWRNSWDREWRQPNLAGCHGAKHTELQAGDESEAFPRGKFPKHFPIDFNCSQCFGEKPQVGYIVLPCIHHEVPQGHCPEGSSFCWTQIAQKKTVRGMQLVALILDNTKTILRGS